MDGIPAATMQDLMELRNSWMESLNDRVVELFFSNGNAAIASANPNPISNSSLSNRVAMYMGRVRPIHTPAGMGLLVGLPAGADFHYPGDPTVVPDVQIRSSGIFPTSSAYRFRSFQKDGVIYLGEVTVNYYMIDKKTIAHTWVNRYWAKPSNSFMPLAYDPYKTTLDQWFQWEVDTLPYYVVNDTANTQAPITVLEESGTHEAPPSFAPIPTLDTGESTFDKNIISHKSADYGLTYWAQAIREQS